MTLSWMLTLTLAVRNSTWPQTAAHGPPPRCTLGPGTPKAYIRNTTEGKTLISAWLLGATASALYTRTCDRAAHNRGEGPTLRMAPCGLPLRCTVQYCTVHLDMWHTRGTQRGGQRAKSTVERTLGEEKLPLARAKETRGAKSTKDDPLERAKSTKDDPLERAKSTKDDPLERAKSTVQRTLGDEKLPLARAKETRGSGLSRRTAARLSLSAKAYTGSTSTCGAPHSKPGRKRFHCSKRYSPSRRYNPSTRYIKSRRYVPSRPQLPSTWYAQSKSLAYPVAYSPISMLKPGAWGVPGVYRECARSPCALTRGGLEVRCRRMAYSDGHGAVGRAPNQERDLRERRSSSSSVSRQPPKSTFSKNALFMDLHHEVKTHEHAPILPPRILPPLRLESLSSSSSGSSTRQQNDNRGHTTCPIPAQLV